MTKYRIFANPIFDNVTDCIYIVLVKIGDDRYEIESVHDYMSADIDRKIPPGVIFQTTGAGVNTLLNLTIPYFRRESWDTRTVVSVTKGEVDSMKKLLDVE